MPSTEEGFGIVFLEAAASGMQVIAGNRDGSIDALAEGAIGKLIDPTDADEVTEAISVALERPTQPDPAAVSRFAFHNFARHVEGLAGNFV
jgi:glycosyltransferase involved in cell wall biosynthesis